MSALPSRPHLDHLRRQAKALLADLRAGDPTAIATFRAHLPDAKRLTADAVRAANLRLADAQSVVARQTGFASWPGLARHVQQLRSLEGEWRFDSLEIDANAVPATMLATSAEAREHGQPRHRAMARRRRGHLLGRATRGTATDRLHAT